MLIKILKSAVLVLSFVYIGSSLADIKIPPTQIELEALIEKEKTTENRDKYLAIYKGVYQLIYGTEKQDLKVAVKRLKKLYKKNKKDTELTVVYGSATTGLAKFEKSVGKRMLWVRKGSILMDKAIRQNPNHLYARIQRAKTALNTPLIMRRIQFVYKDYKAAIAIVETQVKQQKTPATAEQKKSYEQFMAMAHHDIAQAYIKEEKEKLAKNELKKSLTFQSEYWNKKAKTTLTEIK